MGKIIDIQARLARQQDQEQAEALAQWFKEMFGGESTETKREIFEAMRAQDAERYKELTEPIIMRRVIKDMNKPQR